MTLDYLSWRRIEDSAIRPWGTWEVLKEFEGYKVKRLIIEPGKSISRQMHNHRQEIWNIVDGSGVLELGNSVLIRYVNLYKGKSILIDKNQIHKVTASENERLVAIEVQMGTICEEDDIVRFDQ